MHHVKPKMESSMLYIGLPEASTNRKLSFYLAMEEYVARHLDADDSFFMWQVAPSVIFGISSWTTR